MASSGPSGLEGVFFDRRRAGCITMVQMNRSAGKTEMQPFVGEWLLRSEMSTLAGGNRCGNESRMDGKGLEDAHNGVRGDDVVVVREAR